MIALLNKQMVDVNQKEDKQQSASIIVFIKNVTVLVLSVFIFIINLAFYVAIDAQYFHYSLLITHY